MSVQNLPHEYVVFGVTLVGVALFHHRALVVALMGLATASLMGIVLAADRTSAAHDLAVHFTEEWVILSNLLLLLLGFAVVSNQFEKSGLPEKIPARLPDGWGGGVVLLGVVFCLSIFLDNIAGAIIGGVVARHVFPRGVTVGYLAGIVSAANAGGAGSVIGDTTTTMMWISGVSALELLPAFIGSIVAFLIFAPLRFGSPTESVTPCAPGPIQSRRRLGESVRRRLCSHRYCRSEPSR